MAKKKKSSPLSVSASPRSNFLQQIKEKVGNPYSSFGSEDFGSTNHWLDTGSYIFNALISGSMYRGIPGNKITCLAGEPATGKTFFLLGMMKHFLAKDPNAQALLYETEYAISPEILKERQIDGDRVLVERLSTVQEFRNAALQTIELYREQKEKFPLLIGLDSLGNLSTSKEMKDSQEGSETKDMTRAQVIKAAMRVLALKLGVSDVPLIMTNHVYAMVGSMFPTKEMGGGSGPMYMASTIVWLSKRKEKDPTTKEVTGDIIHCYLEKSRSSRPHKQIDVLLTYDRGLHRYYGLEDLAVKHGIFKKLDTRYEMPDGRKVFKKKLLQQPEEYYTEEVMARLEIAAQKEFLYGSSEEPEVDELVEEENKA